MFRNCRVVKSNRYDGPPEPVEYQDAATDRRLRRAIVRISKHVLTLSGWRGLRDQQLLEKSRLVHQLGEAVTGGPDAEAAAAYGITTEALAKLKKETDDYDAVITAPQQAIAERTARTQQLRQRFNAVESQFQVFDRPIELFRATPEGRDMIAAWQASRVIRDLGHGPSSQAPEESPTPEAS